MTLPRIRIAALTLAAVSSCSVLLAQNVQPSVNGGSQIDPSVAGQIPSARTNNNSQMQDSNSSPEATGQEMKDRAFLRKASEGSMAEVEFGQLALRKSGNDEVRKFAQKMVDDHTQLMQTMEPVADNMGIRTPKKINKNDQVEYDKLSALSAGDFDKEYLTFMVTDHHKDLREFRMEAATAADPGLRQAVVAGEKVIREHTRMVDQLAVANGVTVPHGRPAPVMPPPTN